jgi:hypothetical protein
MMLLFSLGSCAKDINTKEAVREAVVKRITSRGDLNMGSMDIEISNVSFQGKTAEATVAFKAKGSAEAMMSVAYKLEREGDAWVVKSGGSSGGSSGMDGGAGGHAGGSADGSAGGGAK